MCQKGPNVLKLKAESEFLLKLLLFCRYKHEIWHAQVQSVIPNLQTIEQVLDPLERFVATACK